MLTHESMDLATCSYRPCTVSTLGTSGAQCAGIMSTYLPTRAHATVSKTFADPTLTHSVVDILEYQAGRLGFRVAHNVKQLDDVRAVRQVL